MNYILTEMDLYGSSSFMLNIVSILSMLLGIYVIISKNPVISILFLIGLFFTMSLYLITIGLHFIGLSYLLVYIGAVSIFFIFIIMLINIRVSELLTDNRNGIPLAILTVLLFNYFMGEILLFNIFSYYIEIRDIFMWVVELFFSLMGNIFSMKNYINLFTTDIQDAYVSSVTGKSWDSIIISLSHISSIGSILYTNLYILLILVSLILLLAMVGAIVITMG